jgi:cell division protein ZapA (FtsZ GTPase activity inhibitor)
MHLSSSLQLKLAVVLTVLILLCYFEFQEKTKKKILPHPISKQLSGKIERIKNRVPLIDLAISLADHLFM